MTNVIQEKKKKKKKHFEILPNATLYNSMHDKKNDFEI